MMPPHTTSIFPTPNTPLLQDTIIIKGYSLDYAAAPIVMDATTGKKVPIEVDIEVKVEGEVDEENPVMGSIQEYSQVSIRLLTLIPNHTYQLTYLNRTVEWQVAQA